MTDEKVNEMYLLARAYCIKKHIWFDDDLIQDLVMYLYSKYDKFDQTKGSFSTFAFMCFKNYLYHNRKSNNEILIENEEEVFTDKYEDSCEKMIIREIMSVICEDSIMVDWLNGLTTEEIASRHNKHRTTISRYISKRLDELRNEYLGG